MESSENLRPNSMNLRHALGQYFTVSEFLQKKVCEFVQNNNCKILEPSFGAGHLLKNFMNRKLVCYEIDSSIKPVVKFNKKHKVHYCDFLTTEIRERFGTIIGNPPYVKNSSGNLYIKFIEKCFELLTEHGEMVFIVPSEFIKVTRSKKFIQKMCSVGTFTHFWFPHDEKLFENASIDVVVFRYQKTQDLNTFVNGLENYYSVSDGMITFSQNTGTVISDLFHVYVGMVSGKDEVFKHKNGNIDILVDENRYEKFVFVEEPNEYLLKYKDVLMNRKIKKFDESNWFEWGAPRNKKNIESNKGKKCIYVKTITRSNKVAFEGTVDYFGGTLLCMIPKSDDVNIENVISFLNSEDFRKNFTFSGRFKIGQRQLSCSFIQNHS